MADLSLPRDWAWYVWTIGGIWSILAGIVFVVDMLILFVTHGRRGVKLFITKRASDVQSYETKEDE